MKWILGLIAGLLVTTGAAKAAGGPYPFAPPVTVPVSQSAYNTTGAQPVSAACSVMSYNLCPNGIVGIVAQGMGNVAIQVSGTFVGTIQFETSLDCVNFTPIALNPQPSGTAVSATNAPGQWTGILTSIICVQGRVTSYSSGTPFITVSVSAQGGSVTSTGGGGGGGNIFAPLTGGATTANGVNQAVGMAATNGANQVPVTSGSPAPQTGAAPWNGVNTLSIGHCVYSTQVPTPASGQTVPCQFDSQGRLLTNSTVFQPTGTNLHTVCDSGCGSGSSPALTMYCTGSAGSHNLACTNPAGTTVCVNNTGQDSCTVTGTSYYLGMQSASNTAQSLTFGAYNTTNTTPAGSAPQTLLDVNLLGITQKVSPNFGQPIAASNITCQLVAGSGSINAGGIIVMYH